MSVGAAPPPVPWYVPRSGFYRLSVAQFQRMIQTGILGEDDRIELLEGHLVAKMPPNPPHSNAVGNASKAIASRLPMGWRMRSEQPIVLADSQPEPDITAARGDQATYRNRHPGPSDFGLLGEVAESTLDEDRDDKGRIYARANLPVYWIINLVDRQVEVYTDPRPADPVPAYATRTDYRPGDSVPLVLDGQTVAHVPVADLLG
jgi:Uma2 family endonuclease